MNDEEDIKIYHYKKEEFVPKQEQISEEEIEDLKNQLPNKFLIFKNRIVRLKREKLTLKQTKTNEIFEELVQRCERRYGKNLEALSMKANVAQMQELDKLLSWYIQEVEKTEQEVEEGKKNKSQDISTYMSSKGAYTSKKIEGIPIASTKMTSKENGSETIVDPDSLTLIQEDEERE